MRIKHCPAVLTGLLLTSIFAPATGSAAASGSGTAGFSGEASAVQLLSTLRFEGAKEFGDEQLRHSLRVPAGLLLLDEPEPTPGVWRSRITESLRGGYLRQGFADVKVELQADGSSAQTVVRIAEGVRCFGGEFRVRGATTITASNLYPLFTALLDEAMVKDSDAHITNQPAAAANPRGAANPFQEITNAALLRRAIALPVEQARPELAAISRLPVVSLGHWEPGFPVRLDAESNAALARTLTNAFTDLGLLGVKFATRYEPGRALPVPPGWEPLLASTNLLERRWAQAQQARAKGHLLDLVIEVEDEGRTGRVAGFRLIGLTNTVAADVEKYLAFPSGQAPARSWLTACEQRLEASGRFAWCRLNPTLPDAQGRVWIEMRALEERHAPPLLAELSSAQAALLRFHRWFMDWPKRDEDLILRLKLRATNASPAEVEVIGSPAGAFLIAGYEKASPEADQLRFGVRMDTAEVLLAAPGIRRKLAAPAPALALEFSVDMAPKSDGTWDLGIGGGFHSRSGRPASRVKMAIPPAAMLYRAHRDATNLQFEGAVLAIRTPDGVLRVDATSGRLLELAGMDQGGAFGWSLNFEAGAFSRASQRLATESAGMTNGFNSREPWFSTASFMLDWAARDAALHGLLPEAMAPGPTTSAMLNGLAGSLGRLSLLRSFPMPRLDQLLSSGDEGREVFVCPTPDSAKDSGRPSGGFDLLAAWALASSGEVMPQGTWLDTWLRLYALRLVGRGDRLQAELTRVMEGTDIGPLGFLAFTYALGPENRRPLAVRGLAVATDEDRFLADCRVLLNERGALGEILCAMLRGMAQLDDSALDEMVRKLPRADADFLRESAAGIRLNLSEPVAAAVGPALRHWWEAALRERVRGQLRAGLRPMGN